MTDRGGIEQKRKQPEEHDSEPDAAGGRARVVALGICRDRHAGADSRYRVAPLPQPSPARGWRILVWSQGVGARAGMPRTSARHLYRLSTSATGETSPSAGGEGSAF